MRYGALKYASKAPSHGRDDLLAAGVRSRLAHGSNRLGQTTRHDVTEIAQIGVDIQGEAMRRDPAAHVNPDGCDFRWAPRGRNPNAGSVRQAAGADAELRKRSDQHF